MKKGNIVTGTILIMLSAYGLYEIGTWIQPSTTVSIKVFPYLIFTLLGISGLILLGKGLIMKEDRKLNFHWNKLLPVGLSVIGYGFIIKYVNYSFATLLFFVVSIYLFGERSWKRILYVSVPGTIAIYILFIEILSVYL